VKRRGVTLIEMLVVVAILGVVAGITYPSIASGLTSLRLTTACDDIASLFNGASNYAQRKQEWVELRIRPDGIEALSRGYTRKIALKDVSITSPERSVFVDPAGGLPGVAVDLRSTNGKTRRVRVDPLNGALEVGDVPPAP